MRKTCLFQGFGFCPTSQTVLPGFRAGLLSSGRSFLQRDIPRAWGVRAVWLSLVLVYRSGVSQQLVDQVGI